LFGSRATGKMRPDSDIDMVVFGPIREADTDRLRSLFDASLLALKVDILAYDRIAYPALKAHIDEVAQALFTAEELKG
jgi:predicted nucleotidyltransferase